MAFRKVRYEIEERLTTAVDKINAARRSANMRAITSRSTTPELLVRELAHGLGFRYRLHGSNLPGKPDLVFAGRKKVIFVHGCFWHQHAKYACLDARLPKSNTAYWHPKLAKNVERDDRVIAALKAEGWKVLVVWECETKYRDRLRSRIRRFLGKLE